MDGPAQTGNVQPNQGNGRAAVGPAGIYSRARQYDDGDFPLWRSLVCGSTLSLSACGGAGQCGGQPAAEQPCRAGRSAHPDYQIHSGDFADYPGAPHRSTQRIDHSADNSGAAAGIFWTAAAFGGIAAGTVLFRVQAGDGFGGGDNGSRLCLFSGAGTQGVFAGTRSVHPDKGRFYQRGADRLDADCIFEQRHLRRHLSGQTAGCTGGAAVCAGRRRALGSHFRHRLRNSGRCRTFSKDAADWNLCAGRTGGRGIFQPGKIWLCGSFCAHLWGNEPSFRSAAGDAAGVRRVHQCGDVAVAAAERFVCAAGKAVPPTDGQRGEKRAPADAGAAGRGKRCAAGDRAHHSGGLSPAGQGQSRQPGAGV